MKTATKLEGNPPIAPEKQGYSRWIEWGVWYEAPTVDPTKFGPHEYDNGDGTGHCECGCYMGGSSSSGNVDPFGACPCNPIPKELHNL